MSNVFFDLPTAVGNGVGTVVDVSSMGATKTIAVNGSAQVSINVEINNDAAQAGGWQSVFYTQNKGFATINTAARFMRVRSSGYNFNLGGTTTVQVGGTDAGSQFVNLAVPAGNGVGAATDVSGLNGLFKTFQIAGTFKGTVIIEVGEDGTTDWTQPVSTTTPTAINLVIASKFMRVRRSGVPEVAPGLPVVNVGITPTAEDGGGGAANTVDVEDDGTPIGTFTTLNFTGDGVNATDDGGGVAEISIPGTLNFQDEGSDITSSTTANFTGAGVTVSDVGGVATINIPGSGAGGVDLEINGTPEGNFTTLNFEGAVDFTDAGGGQADITIGVAVEDGGSPILSPATTMNFTGAGVTVTDVGGVATIDIPGSAGGVDLQINDSPEGNFTTLNLLGSLTFNDAGGGQADVTFGVAVQDDGGPVLSPTTILNFVGDGVVASTPSPGQVDVAIAGGVNVEDEGVPLGSFVALNFTGAGVTATDAGAGLATINVPGGIDGIDLESDGTPVAGTFTTLNFETPLTVTDAGGGQANIGVNVLTGPFFFGTGSDGNTVLDGVATVLGMVPSGNVYTGLRTYQFNNLTINSGITFRPSGYPYYVNGDLAGSGTIETNGFPGTGGSGSGGTVGPAPYNATRPLPNGTAGGLAGLQDPGPSPRAIRGAVAGHANGGAVGQPGANGGAFQGGGGGSISIGTGGANGGEITLVADTVGDWEQFQSMITGYYLGPANANSPNFFTIGTGGGGGEGGSGGGGSGGWHVGFVRNFAGTVVIESRGGAGANGVNFSGFSAAGAGGGAGGLVILVAGGGTIPTPNVSGGTGGSPSVGTGTGFGGGTGGAGLFRVIQAQ